jgi:hypothetical protein
MTRPQLKRGGLRLYHPTLRDAVLLVPVPKKRPEGRDKDIQLVVDPDGYVLVSEAVWDSLTRGRKAGSLHEFIVVNTVETPPTQTCGFIADTHRRTYRQEQAALRELAPAGVTTRITTNPINVRSN